MDDCSTCGEGTLRSKEGELGRETEEEDEGEEELEEGEGEEEVVRECVGLLVVRTCCVWGDGRRGVPSIATDLDGETFFAVCMIT